MLTKEYFTFFSGLEKNNNKEWFDAHRKDYEEHVKAPFHNLVTQLIEAVRAIEPEIQMTAKDAIFRINRDIRFSKDKSPYKTHMSAHITKYGKKEIGRPGFYFEVHAKGGGFGGGCYMPDKESLTLIRDLIMHEGKDLRRILSSKSFKSTFKEIQGEKNKVLPAEFKDAALAEPLLYNKQFFYWTEIPKSAFTDAKAIKNLMTYVKTAKPVYDFFNRAFS
jgi:uncharacterized protein (TIGR02453 family)